MGTLLNLSLLRKIFQIFSTFITLALPFYKRKSFNIKEAQRTEVEIQRIVVEKEDGKKLVGLLNETGSPAVIVMCHGFRSSKKSRTIVEITGALVERNLSVFRFDFSGNGESDGDFDYSNYWGEVDDLRAVVQYLTGQRREISGIIGHSKGANVVLLYASKYHDVPAVVNVSARYNLKEGMKERFGMDFMETLKRDGYIDVRKKKKGKVGKFDYRVTLQSVQDRLKTDMEEACSQIDPKCRVLTVHGSEDEITPHEDASLFHKIVPNHKMHTVQGANHCYIDHREELNSAILSFIQ